MNFLKKSAIILLTFFYSVCAVGMQVNVHYCHGKISSVSLDVSKSDCCCEKNKKPKKCCSDKKVQLKIETKNLRITEKRAIEAKPLAVDLPEAFSFAFAENKFISPFSLATYKSLRLSCSDRHLKCRVFRI